MTQIRILQKPARGLFIFVVNHEAALHHRDATVHNAGVLVEFDDRDAFGLQQGAHKA
jgi:hypothetical protein